MFRFFMLVFILAAPSTGEELFEHKYEGTNLTRYGIVQSGTISELRGMEIVRVYLDLVASDVDVLYLRDFSEDKQFGNRRVVERNLSTLISNALYRNVSVLGNVRNLKDSSISYTLADLPCATEKLFKLLDKANYRPEFISIMSDSSWLSRKLTSCILHELVKQGRKSRITQIGSVLDLREHVRSLDKRKPGLLVNAVFNIRNFETMLEFDAARVVLEIRRWNRKHLEVGVIKHKRFPFNEGITIGYSAIELAKRIVDPAYVPAPSVLVDTERLDKLDLKRIYMANILLIDGVTQDANYK
jgi:hypothetical protein